MNLPTCQSVPTTLNAHDKCDAKRKQIVRVIIHPAYTFYDENFRSSTTRKYTHRNGSLYFAILHTNAMRLCATKYLFHAFCGEKLRSLTHDEMFVHCTHCEQNGMCSLHDYTTLGILIVRHRHASCIACMQTFAFSNIYNV